MTNVKAIDCASKLNANSAAALKAAGVELVLRYLGPESNWKSLLSPEVSAVTSAGLDICSIYETAPTHPEYFTESQAAADEKAAAGFAQSIGQPLGSAIYFTVDYNASIHDLGQISKYFDSLVDSLSGYDVGAYGEFEVVEYLAANSKVKKFMQTYAWSGGKVSAHANLYQYLNGQVLAGVSVDFDKVISSPGSWNLSKPEPKPAPVPEKKSVEPATVVVWENYKIVSGDTLSQIAAAHDISVEALASKNGIAHTGEIFAGQVIKVPVKEKSPVPVSHPTSHIEWKSYKIVSGDSLSEIAVKYGTSVSALAEKNGIDNPGHIEAGQVILVPETVQGPAAKYHTVVPGDSLSEIAAASNISLSELLKLNPSVGVNDIIHPGDKIRVE